MKVIFITSESALDHSYTMINELKNHIELKPYIIAKELTPELNEYCKELNVKFVKRLSFKNPLSPLKELLFLLKLRKEKADLVWFNRATLYQAFFLKFVLKKFIINIHDVDLHPEEKDYHGIVTQKLIFRFYKKNVAVMSKTQAEIFENRYKHTPFLFQLPVIDYYKKVSPGSSAVSGISKEVKFFFFGTVLPYKGFETLIKAASILAERNGNFRLNIYGKIKYNTEQFLKQISENPRISLVDKFIDYKEVSSVFARNDVLIIPYIQVSQCGPLLISYSESVPVICNNLPGFSEYVDDGSSGLLFKNSAESLAEKMESIILNREQLPGMKEYIQNSSLAKFSMQSLAKDYVTAFQQAIKND